MSLKAMASCLGISERTLYRKRLKLGIDVNRFTDITDNELERIIRPIVACMPNTGETYLEVAESIFLDGDYESSRILGENCGNESRSNAEYTT